MKTIRYLASLVMCLAALTLASCKGGSNGTASTSLDPPPVPDPPGAVPAFPLVDHVNQFDITLGNILFLELFILGDELFEAQYNALDGIGALRLPDGTPFRQRFSRVPPGGGRFTGPNGDACAGCHNVPFPASAGDASSNVIQDPAKDGVGPFNNRNTTSLFGSGVLQVLAEEITADLLEVRDDAAAAALPGGAPVTLPLDSKGLSFGTITATRDAFGIVTFDLSGIEGIDPDLVVRPFGWKGHVTALRDFVRGAAFNEMGMESDEIVDKIGGGDPDPDGDGVEGELSVGDITALVVYIAAQEVPTTLEFLVREGLEPRPTRAVAAAIAQGEALFDAIGCTDCHVPELRIDTPIFEEPTRRGGGHYFDPDLDPATTGYDPDRPFRFHLVQEGDEPRLAPHPNGGARVRLFGDLKRHRMGAQLADAQEMCVTDASGAVIKDGAADVTVDEMTFLTAELWGVGNSGPWLHDGRAASIRDAILLHGTEAPPAVGDPARSEAQESRDAFLALTITEQDAVIEFLESLVLFAFEEEE